jgi:hypothetical protein
LLFLRAFFLRDFFAIGLSIGLGTGSHPPTA